MTQSNPASPNLPRRSARWNPGSIRAGGRTTGHPDLHRLTHPLVPSLSKDGPDATSWIVLRQAQDGAGSSSRTCPDARYRSCAVVDTISRSGDRT